MFALLKKDWRLNAVPIFGGTLLVATPYIVVLLVALTEPSRTRYRDLPDDLRIAAIMGTLLTIAVTAVFGGAAFAQERRERSANFLAMLPVSREKIVLSKAIVGILCPVVLWAANLIVYYQANTLGAPSPTSHVSVLFAFMSAGEAMLIAFGVAWFASAFLSSSSIAACIGIGAVVALGLLALLPDRLLAQIADIYKVVIVLIALGVPGVVGFIAGTLHYIQRIEP